MAGIGFQLKKMLAADNYIGLFGAYAYAGIITSGPWIIAIITILALTLLTQSVVNNVHITQSFQSIIVYLIAGSLILSSVFHHSYTRFIADIFYKKNYDLILPTLNGIYTVMLLVAFVVGFIAVNLLIPNETHFVKGLIISCFTILNLIWITTSVMSGLLAYRTIFSAFLVSFIISISSGFFLHKYGLSGLLFSFMSGEFMLLMILVNTVYRFYPSDELVRFDFFTSSLVKKILIFSGLFYNVGIWIDKFIFWYHPLTGIRVIGHLSQSLIYDTPIFMAYLAVIPGTITFLMHMETEFADAYEEFYDYVRGDNTFNEINHAYHKLIYAGRDALNSIIKSQLYLILLTITLGSTVFYVIHISFIYLPLFYICFIAASLNVIFWAALDIVFYLDKIYLATFLSGFFMLSNALLTWLSISLGILYFGYGLLASLLLTVMLSFFILNYEIRHLKYETYMLTPIA